MLELVDGNELGAAHFDVSAKGTLVYTMGTIRPKELYELEWIDRAGDGELLMPADDYREFKLSPNGRLLAYSRHRGRQADIWIHDIERGASTRLTSDPGDDVAPIWSPSGQTIVFGSERDGWRNLYCKRVDDNQAVYRLTENPNLQLPWSWHPESHHIAVLEYTPGGKADLRIVNLEGNDESGWRAVETTDFVVTEIDESSASFSPDGRWLAYASIESGQWQVFGRSFPDVERLRSSPGRKKGPRQKAR